jgi:hypothetical protein
MNDRRPAAAERAAGWLLLIIGVPWIVLTLYFTTQAALVLVSAGADRSQAAAAVFAGSLWLLFLWVATRNGWRHVRVRDRVTAR